MRTDLPIGIQMFNLRNEAAKDFKGTVQQVKDLGFDFVELAGLYGHTYQEIKDILDEVGIPALSAHIPYQELVADPEGVLEGYKLIGIKYAAFPYLDETVRPGTDAFPETLKNMRHIAEIAKGLGIQMMYHNHDFEFIKMPNGQFGLDYMYSEIPADLLTAELDLCWVKVAGQDPVAYLDKYAGRIPVIHLKDFYQEGVASNMYELIGIAKKEETRGYFRFRPLSYGKQFWPPILEAAKKDGAKYLIYEQDMSYTNTPIQNAKLSIDYLKG